MTCSPGGSGRLCACALGVALALAPERAVGADAGGDSEAPVDAKEAARLRAEAEATLAKGQFDRARREFERVLKQFPTDASAQRNAARAAQAAGEFEYAAAALERAHHLEEHSKDPELHYLRGEALYVLKRPQEAVREHRIAELELGRPVERMPKLWLARIWARRGWIDRADSLYETMWPPAPEADVEVALNHADAHLLNEDWGGAIRILDRLLARRPREVRAREMLAWALEATGDLDREMAVRGSLVEDSPTMAHHWDYGRALERANDYRGADGQYTAATDAAGSGVDPALTLSASRMHARVSVEGGGAFVYRRDPSASAIRMQLGLSWPFGTRHSAAGVAWYERAWGGYPHATASVGGIAAGLLLGSRWGGTLTMVGNVRFTGSQPDGTPPGWAPGVKVSTVQAGGTINAQTPLFSFSQIDLQADVNNQWAESPIALQQGGTVSGGTGHFYLFPRSRRFLVNLGGQIRRLSLAAPEAGGGSPDATQKLFWAGGDLVLWNNPQSVLKGDSMDDTLVRRTYLADSAVLSYRHYELFTSSDPDFRSRIFLSPRAAINNGTATVRMAFLGGRLGLEARGGVGYDTERRLYLYQGGGSLLLASWSGRLSLSYDFMRESATGFQGMRQIGWLSYHAEF